MRFNLTLLAGAGLSLALSVPAFADIKAYNAAVQRGDFPTAAAEVGPIWSGYDKTSDDAVVVAREFAWMSMIGGKPDQANGIAHWLVDQGPKAPHPDPHPQTAMVLLRWTELGDNPTPTAIKALSDAVAARAAVSDPGDMISVAAAQQLYAVEWKLGQWSDVERDAGAATALAGPLRKEGAEYSLQARMMAAAAEFMDQREIGPYFKMAEVRQALVDRLDGEIHAVEEDASDSPLYALSNRAAAWMLAMRAYYVSVEPAMTKLWWQAEFKKARALQIKGKCGLDPCPVKLAPGKLPACKVSYTQNPQLTYPRDARLKGIVGDVRLRVTTDEAGKVSAARVLAAVPSDLFPDPSISAVSKWTVKRSTDQRGPCTLAGTRLLDISYLFPS